LITLFSALVIMIAAPIHAAHGHDDERTTTSLHAPCAACQVHAPAGTLAAAAVNIVEPDDFSHFVQIHTVDFGGSFHGGITACRAPPFRLAA
jgi:hypothetical protein